MTVFHLRVLLCSVCAALVIWAVTEERRPVLVCEELASGGRMLVCSRQ